MSAALESGQVERFRGLLQLRLGLHFEDAKLSELAEVLARRLRDAAVSCDLYLSRLQAAEMSHDERRALARELTVGETYFFRNPDQFRAFSEVALPERGRSNGDGRRVRILSAGCASGEEPYSLAILLSQRTEAASIRAVDVNASALERAAQGRYSAWALRETPPEVRHRWFRPQGQEFVLAEGLRRWVTFEERNLAEADPELWPPDGYDIVFCRNVLMYFTPRQAVALVERIARSLAPGGYLFLGHAETLRGLSQEFHLRHTHGTFYYERRGAASPPLARPGGFPAEAPLDPGPLMQAMEGAETWVDAIRRASDRIRDLARGGAGRGREAEAAAAAGGRSLPPWDLGSAMELLKAERFGEALDVLRRLPPEAAADAEVLLLRATLFTHHGQLAEAEQGCRELLRIDEFNAGAHYLLALCREGRGDAEGARHHDQLAAHVDPGFAMPRLHLGLLARRTGDLKGAGRELAEALDLLRREDGSRLLLFGGGFTREALVALCRAELVACGGTA